MTTCPFCGFENIEGVDVCDECEQSLEELSKPRPAPGIEERLFKDRIRFLEPNAPLVVPDDAPVREVIKLLVSRSVGCAIVTRAGDVVGIFSERDALLRLGARAVELGDHPIREFMTESPEMLDEGDKIAFALHKMDIGGYRHLPILHEGSIAGVISIRDILRYITDHILGAPA